MDIAILHQYPDFRRTVFYELLRQESRTPIREVSPEKADLVIYGPFARYPKIIGRFVKRKASFGPLYFKRRSLQPISIFHTIENVRHEQKFDYSISYDYSIEKCDYRFPYWMESIDWSHEGVSRPAPLRVSRYFEIAELQKPLGKFLQGRNGNCAGFFGQVSDPRKSLMESVAQILKLDTYGPAFDRSIKNSQSSGIFKDSVLQDYSYNLCPENALYPGYYTEKVLESFASGCLPITWAEQNICHDFNPNAFLNLLDYAPKGYNGWCTLINDSESREQFESSELLNSTPSIEPLREFTKDIIKAAL